MVATTVSRNLKPIGIELIFVISAKYHNYNIYKSRIVCENQECRTTLL